MSRLRFSFCLILFACSIVTLSAAARADDPPSEEGFKPIFDGKSLQGWQGYKSKSPPGSWTVEDGALARTGRGGDLMTIDKYGDFELRLDWKVSPGANSGIMYRVATNQPASYMTGPEYQVLDNDKHADGKKPETAAGSLYALYAPTSAKVKPVGDYNTARILVKGNHLEHWLNDQKVVDCDIGSDDWNQRIKASKFNNWKAFAKSRAGHIVLQDHGDKVWYRNIRIKKLGD